MSDITSIEQEALAAIQGAASLEALDAVRVAELGKKGRVSGLMGTLGAMSPEERKEKGPALNALKGRIEDAVRVRKGALEAKALEAKRHAEEALRNRSSAMDYATAEAELAEAIAQLQAINKMRKGRH